MYIYSFYPCFRIAPLYYLTQGVTFYLGQWHPWQSYGLWPQTLLTLTMTNTFAFGECLTDHHFYLPFPYNGLSWTVCTLVAFYTTFPLLLPPLQKLSSRSLCTLLVLLFHLQCWPVALYLLPPHGTMRYYWLAAANPLARFPVFAMGVVAGILRLRGENYFNLSYSCSHPLARYSPNLFQ